MGTLNSGIEAVLENTYLEKNLVLKDAHHLLL